MKNTSRTGLTAMDVVNPNAEIGRWLDSLAESGAVTRETLRAASLHFGLRRGSQAWLLFFKRIFALLGVILGVCGLIFFMAWNWEDMSRIAKFATLEAVFVLLGAYSVLRRQTADGRARWDARVALFGAAMLSGGMLALYGQIYQTGADPWELFRAWALLLVIFALPGRATAFWFMVWLTCSLWLALYLHASGMTEIDFLLPLALAGAEFAILAVNEAARRFLAGRGIAYDHERWLSRVIGVAAIACMACFAVMRGLEADYYYYATMSSYGILCYFLSLGVVFFIYYRLIPDLLFLALSIFSLAIFIIVEVSESLLRNLELGDLLTLGLLIVALAFGALKAILELNKAIGKRALQSQEARSEARAAAHSLSFFRNREAKKAELETWLLERGAGTSEAILACYAADEKKRELESPWYAKILVSLGVWLGSGLALAAFTLLVFSSLQNPSGLGFLGLVLCGLSIQIGQGKTLPLRAFGQVLGICGLIYAALLFNFDERPTALLLCALLTLFCLLKPPFTARLAACLGALACLFFWLGEGYHSYYYFTGDSDEQLLAPSAIWHVKTLLYCLGLLWSAHYLVVMDGRAPAGLKKPAGEWLAARFNAAEALGASAYACLIFFAGLALSPHLPYLDQSGINPLMPWLLNLRLGTAALFAVLTGLMAWRFPAARQPALALGPILAVSGWFAPCLALGFVLLLLAFHTGLVAFLGAAVAYLGCATWLYYYNLDLTLLYKSLVLMGSGLVLLALSLGLTLLSRRRTQ